MDRGEYSVAVQPTDGGSGGNMDAQTAYRRSSNVRTEMSVASPISGTSAVVDASGNTHKVGLLINPGSPKFSEKLNGQASLRQSFASGSQQNNFSENYLPLGNQPDTLVITETMMLDGQYSGPIDSSNISVSYPLNDELTNNQSYSSSGQVAQPFTPTTPQLAFSQLAPLGQYQQEPMLTQYPVNSLSNEAQSYSYGDSSAHSGYTADFMGLDSSSMVTGLGNGDAMMTGVDMDRPTNLSLLPNGMDGMVFSESQAVMARRVDTIPSTPLDTLPMEYPIFPTLEDVLPADLFVQENLLEDFNFPNQTMVQATEETKQKPGAIGEDLNIIKMMNKKPKRNQTRPGLVAPSYPVPPSQFPASPKTPMTPYSTVSPSPCTPLGYPVQASSPANSMMAEPIPSPASSLPPETPVTPAPSTQGPFYAKCYVKNGIRYFELSTREDLSQSDHLMALKALFYCGEMCMKFKECMVNPCDLKVANNICAQLCDFTFDTVNNKLISRMPSNCVSLEKFLRANSEKIDLRVRHLLLQQVVNALATIHTIGNDDKLNLWGSFLVWVAPNMGVYLLLDFPVMLAKMEQSCAMRGFDPRLEDNKSVLGMYREMFKPYICSDSSWVSPGLHRVLKKRFEDILLHPAAGAQMAEIARNFGERRMCKIEVDVLSLDTVVYCLEHETLQQSLSPLENVIPLGISGAWEVQRMEDARPVGKEDIAIAEQVMRFQVVPCFDLPSPYEQGLLIHTRS